MSGNLECYLNGRILQEHKTRHQCACSLQMTLYCSTVATFPCMSGNLECYLNGRIIQEHKTRHQCACSLQMTLYLLNTHTLPEVYRKTWNLRSKGVCTPIFPHFRQARGTETDVAIITHLYVLDVATSKQS